MIKKCISVTSHALDPLPPVTNCHTYSDPPSSVTYFMDAFPCGSACIRVKGTKSNHLSTERREHLSFGPSTSL